MSAMHISTVTALWKLWSPLGCFRTPKYRRRAKTYALSTCGWFSRCSLGSTRPISLAQEDIFKWFGIVAAINRKFRLIRVMDPRRCRGCKKRRKGRTKGISVVFRVVLACKSLSGPGLTWFSASLFLVRLAGRRCMLHVADCRTANSETWNSRPSCLGGRLSQNNSGYTTETSSWLR